MSASTYKFLHKIVAPQLTDANFGQNLAEQFANINMNFQRLASAAYLTGQQGNDVIIKRMDLLYPELSNELDPDTGERLPKRDEDGNIIYSKYITNFAVDLLNCIVDYPLFAYDEDLTLEDIDGTSMTVPYSDYESAKEKGFLFSESIKRNPYIDFFAIHDNDTLEDKLVCATQMYYFFDYRNGSLDLIDDVTEKIMDINTDDNPWNDFNDYTCFIICTYANGEFKFEKSTHMPTLYFDSSRGEFCWKFNGIDSNITAQGVKGDKGDSARCWFCKGSAEVRDGIINCSIDYVYTSAYGEVNPKDERIADEFKVDDLCCVECYAGNDEINSTYLDTIFGNVQYDSNSEMYYVSRDYDTSINNMIDKSKTALWNYLKQINTNYDASSGKTDDVLHGLFLPSPDGKTAHMINVAAKGYVGVDTGDMIHIHPGKIENVFGSIPKYNVDGNNEQSVIPKLYIDGYDILLKNPNSLKDINLFNFLSSQAKVGDIIQNSSISKIKELNNLVKLANAYVPIPDNVENVIYNYRALSDDFTKNFNFSFKFVSDNMMTEYDLLTEKDDLIKTDIYNTNLTDTVVIEYHLYDWGKNKFKTYTVKFEIGRVMREDTDEAYFTSVVPMFSPYYIFKAMSFPKYEFDPSVIFSEKSNIYNNDGLGISNNINDGKGYYTLSLIDDDTNTSYISDVSNLRVYRSEIINTNKYSTSYYPSSIPFGVYIHDDELLEQVNGTTKTAGIYNIDYEFNDNLRNVLITVSLDTFVPYSINKDNVERIKHNFREDMSCYCYRKNGVLFTPIYNGASDYMLNIIKYGRSMSDSSGRHYYLYDKLLYGGGSKDIFLYQGYISNNYICAYKHLNQINFDGNTYTYNVVTENISLWNSDNSNTAYNGIIFDIYNFNIFNWPYTCISTRVENTEVFIFKLIKTNPSDNNRYNVIYPNDNISALLTLPIT